MGKIKVNEIEKHDATEVTVNSNVVMAAGTSISTDTISEKTTATGVTIDSVTLKDGAVVGAALTDYVETDVALSSSSGDIAIDMSNGNTGSITLSENITTLTFTNVPTNGTSSFTLKVTQDGTGSRTMAITGITINGGSTVTGLTPGAAGLTLSTGAADIDLVSFLFFDAGTPLINSLLDFS
jgi:hypothetical protein